MKTSLRLLFVAMIIMLEMGLVLNLQAEGDEAKDAYSAMQGWQQYFERKPKLYTDKIHVDMSLNATVDKKVGFTFSIDTNFSFIDCCKGTDNPFAWCDFDEQNTGC